MRRLRVQSDFVLGRPSETHVRVSAVATNIEMHETTENGENAKAA